MSRLEGKVAIVTGGGGKIGSAFARRLSRDGAAIVVADINKETASLVAREIEDKGGKAIPATLDLADLPQVQSMVETAIRHFGKIDILCNVAGIGPRVADYVSPLASWRGKMFWEVDPKTWDYHIRANLYTAMNCCYAVIPHMIQRKYGRIINYETGSVLTGQRGVTLYQTAKGGIYAFTKCLAKELGVHGVTVNAVSHGGDKRVEYFAYGPAERYASDGERYASSHEEGQDRAKREGREGGATPEEIADLGAFLASDDAQWISAQSITVSGAQFPR